MSRGFKAPQKRPRHATLVPDSQRKDELLKAHSREARRDGRAGARRPAAWRSLTRSSLLAVTIFALLVGARAASAATIASATWAGADATGFPEWSAASNWSTGAGNSVPGDGDTINTLNFPELSGCNTLTMACYEASNDLTGLTVNRLDIDDGVYQDEHYEIDGNTPITLAGGITAASTSSKSSQQTEINPPITFGGPQTWSISGNFANTGGTDVLWMGGNLTGASDSLGVTLADGGDLQLLGTDEVGAVTITGLNTGDTGSFSAQNGTLILANIDDSASDLNGKNGNAVSITDAALTANNASIGSLTVDDGQTSIGDTGNSVQTLSIKGSATFDGGLLNAYISAPGTKAGTDYPQISATGTLDLNGVQLELNNPNDSCLALTPGSGVETLVSAASISGTFAGIPNGAVVPVQCNAGQSGAAEPFVMINYASTSITATPVSSYTWNGTAASPKWDSSSPTNWISPGGSTTAPSATVGALDFPQLADACSTSCYTSDDDLGQITTGALAFGGNYSYTVTDSGGNGVTLGGGGINDDSVANATFDPSITLGAPQTWNIVGGGDLALERPLAGSSEPLALQLSAFGPEYPQLTLSGDNEVGAVTVNGDGVAGQAQLNLYGNTTSDLASLNATDGHAVTLTGQATLSAGLAAVGELTSQGSSVDLAPATRPPAPSASRAPASTRRALSPSAWTPGLGSRSPAPTGNSPRREPSRSAGRS